ncbi:MAG: GNAT family N-acetyltransferase [Clostridia bacterium]|nr:GNAT family N-acetyltransferase [Clostridia bacterium]
MEFRVLNDTNDEIKALRTQTFVVEKNVPEEIEFDGKDNEYIHFCLYEGNMLIACARASVTENIVHLGRVAVKTEFRGKGHGKILFEYIEEFALKNGCNQMELGAINTAVGFYEKIGFKAVGEYYIEAGWPHINMVKKIA